MVPAAVMKSGRRGVSGINFVSQGGLLDDEYERGSFVKRFKKGARKLFSDAEIAASTEFPGNHPETVVRSATTAWRPSD